MHKFNVIFLIINVFYLCACSLNKNIRESTQYGLTLDELKTIKDWKIDSVGNLGLRSNHDVNIWSLLEDKFIGKNMFTIYDIFGDFNEIELISEQRVRAVYWVEPAKWHLRKNHMYDGVILELYFDKNFHLIYVTSLV